MKSHRSAKSLDPNRMCEQTLIELFTSDEEKILYYINTGVYKIFVPGNLFSLAGKARNLAKKPKEGAPLR